MVLNNKVYDVLKYIDMVFLPALLTFYGVVGATLHIPYVQETLTIGTAFVAFLGALLGVSSSKYNKVKGKKK